MTNNRSRSGPVKEASCSRDYPDPLVTRIRGEYAEMPGLRLTFDQACRLWQLDARTCEVVLHVLIAEGFLVRTTNGAFIATSAKQRRTKDYPSTTRQRRAG